MPILDVLQELYELLSKHGYGDHAPLVRRLLELHNDEKQFWLFANSNDFWGGSGSLADMAFCLTPRSANDAGFLRDRRRFSQLMLEFGQTVLAQDAEVLGASINPRLESWLVVYERDTK